MASGRHKDVVLIKGLPLHHVMKTSDDKNITEYLLVPACRHTNYK